FLFGLGAAHASLAFQRSMLEQERVRLHDLECATRLQAEHASQVRDAFLTAVSHELRTPLNTILGWAQVLRLRPDESVRTQAVDAIERGSRAEARLIDDLLDMSRAVSGTLVLEVQDIDMPALVGAVVEEMRPSADAKEIAIQETLDAGCDRLRGDPARI